MENKLVEYKHSRAEQAFYDWMKSKYPKLKVTKKGMPDFMVLDGEKVIGFVEVKQMNLGDNLRKEQHLFRKFCAENKIPYQMWRPGLDYFKNQKIATGLKHKTTKWEL